MKQIQAFFAANKVFIMGLLGAIIIAVINVSDEGLTWSGFAMPAVLAITSYIGKNLRGQWSSIAGIFFTVIIGLVQSKINHVPFHFDAAGFKLIMLQVATLYFGYVAPPAKPASYETNPVIEKAKS